MHDAEDAFQATFVVVVRKAATVVERESIACWLHQVAYRIALRARANRARIAAHEQASSDIASAADPPDLRAEAVWHDLRPLLDQELNRLPEKYRAPLLLCYLEGKSYAEAAQQLGCPKGTVAIRLSRGRELLRVRLSRRGLGLTVRLVATGLSHEAASASVPSGSVASTVRNATVLAVKGAVLGNGVSAQVASLADGLLRGRFLSQVRFALVVLLAVSMVTGRAGLIARQALAVKPVQDKHTDRSAAAAQPAAEPKVERARRTRADLYGDPLPPGALVRMGTVRFRPADWVRSLAFLQGGKIVVSTGHKGIKFWETATGEELNRMEAPGGGVWRFAVSPHAKLLAAGCFDDRTRIWDLATRRELQTLPTPPTHALAFSQNGRLLATCGVHALQLWDWAAGQEAVRIGVQMPGPQGIVFTADDQEVIGWDFFTVGTWEVASGRQLHEVKSKVIATSISNAVSADGKLLATTDKAKLHLRNWTTGQELRQWDSHGDRVIGFSPDGAFLVSTGEERTSLWDVATGQEVQQIPEASITVAFRPDGRVLALGRERVLLWDLAAQKPLLEWPSHASGVDRLAFSPNGRTLASLSRRDRTIRLWDAHTGRQLHVLGGGEPNGYPLAYAPDSKILAAGYPDGTIRLWNPVTGKEIRRFALEGQARMVDAIQFSPDGRTLAASSGVSGPPDQTRPWSVLVWDVATGRRLVRHNQSRPFVGGVAFSPDGKELALAEISGLVLWDLARGRERLRVPGTPQDKPGQIAFSPDGRILAATEYGSRDNFKSWDYTVRLLQVTTGRELLRFTDSYVGCLAFSPDGKLIASRASGEAIRLWEVATGKECFRLPGNGTRVGWLAFSPDGKTLASGLADCTALIWDLDPGPMPAQDLGSKDLEQLWTDLASEDAFKAYRAIWALAGLGDKAIALFRDRLQPASGEEHKRIQKLIADLDNSRYAVREHAFRQLQPLGIEADSALLAALEKNPSLERRQRIQALLELPRVVRSSETLRQLRAIQVLERIRPSESRQMLERLAKGAPEAMRTQEARAALERLAKRPAAVP
jgi:RNA polymerase sigma factor (sigma-70 family)